MQSNGEKSLKLTFEEIQNIAGMPIDHSFLRYKKELGTRERRIFISSRIPDSDSLLMDETESCHELKQIIRDTAIAIENILIQATHMGLASCWTG